jgi:SET domain-containing protein
MPRRPLVVRDSAIHGRGAFAAADLAAGDLISVYSGQLIDWPEATRRYQDLDVPAGHTFFFDLGDGHVIDGGRGGNAARWINHGCEPNCEAAVEGRTVEILAARDIVKGEELLLDYQLELDPTATAAERKAYACRCGAASCRGTMLAAPPPASPPSRRRIKPTQSARS